MNRQLASGFGGDRNSSTSPEARSQGRCEPISVRLPEAVRLTGLSRSRLYELIKSGEIKIAKVGASTLVLYDSLRGFVERARR